MPPNRAAPYTRGEAITMWLCWLTPGIAAGSFYSAYLLWWFRRFGFFGAAAPFWHGPVLYGSIAVVLCGCAGYAAAIHAGKTGRERFRRRALKLAFLFVLAQVFVLPLVGWIMAYLILRL